MVDGEMRSFVECGGTSVDAVSIGEDLKHTFIDHCSLSDDGDNAKFTLLLDKILHSSLNDVVRYISSQLNSFISNAAVASADDDENHLTAKTMSQDVLADTQHKISASSHSITTSSDLSSRISCHPHNMNLTQCNIKSHSESFYSASSPPAKRQRTTELNSSTLTDVGYASRAVDEFETVISKCDNDENAFNTATDDDAKCKQTDVYCRCQAVLSSSIGGSSRRVFCKGCYQRVTSLAYDFSKLPLLRSGITTTASFVIFRLLSVLAPLCLSSVCLFVFCF